MLVQSFVILRFPKPSLLIHVAVLVRSIPDVAMFEDVAQLVDGER